MTTRHRNKNVFAYRKVVLLFLLSGLLMVFNSVSAQTMNYSIGFTGNLIFNNRETPSNTFPLVGSIGTKCLIVDNGLTKFLPSGTNTFTTTCDVSLPAEPLQILLYPNPITTGYVIVKAVSNINTTSKFLIQILNMNGKPLISRTASGVELLSGVRINIIPGFLKNIYVINVSSDRDKISASNKLIILK